jgi:hypothetical protein
MANIFSPYFQHDEEDTSENLTEAILNIKDSATTPKKKNNSGN